MTPIRTQAELDLLVLDLQERASAAGSGDALVILQPSELARLVVEARTQGYERGRADALRELAVEALPA